MKKIKSKKQKTIRKCRVCGCTDDNACINEYGEPCHWVETDLCSNCSGKETK